MNVTFTAKRSLLGAAVQSTPLITLIALAPNFRLERP